MNKIENQTFDEERTLYGSNGLTVSNCAFDGPADGESAFKESGAIEYGSDVLIGLQLKGAGKKDFDVNEAKSKDPRTVQLLILKNRNGAITKEPIDLEYHARFNYFEDPENRIKPKNRNLPLFSDSDDEFMMKD